MKTSEFGGKYFITSNVILFMLYSMRKDLNAHHVHVGMINHAVNMLTNNLAYTY